MAIDLKFADTMGGKVGVSGLSAATVDTNSGSSERESLAGATIMEELRRGTRGAKQPSRLPLIGGMPIARQFQVLAIALLAFFILAALMALVSGRIGTQNAAATGAATEMQMLSQRLARGSALTSIGNKDGFKQVKEARDAFRANLDALTKGGTVRGVDVSATESRGDFKPAM